MKRAFLRLLRKAVSVNPDFFKKIFYRLRVSRFFKLASWLVWGEDFIRWRGILVKVNPGRINEFFLYFFEVFAEEEIEQLIEFSKGRHVFADVGANIGLVSLAVAHACPELEVFAFEANHNATGEFSFNLGLNSELSEKVHIVERAIAEENRKLFFCPSNDRKQIETGQVREDNFHDPNGYSVDAVSLDSFFQQIGKFPEVVKIDVEGAELRVLEGMRRIFRAGFPKSMLIEVHPCYFEGEVLDCKIKINSILKDSNYELFLFDNGRKQELPKPEDWPLYFHILALKT